MASSLMRSSKRDREMVKMPDDPLRWMVTSPEPSAHTGDDVIDGAFTIDDVPIAERDVAGELAGATKIERAEVVLLEGT
ncbi:hypothetical protein PRIPAC_86581 [Pristionchus pacificus]|uniref:Uncharacterized protein n=1 Tax=Pristionchus pacificus TaxID=54126 RepID=A0A2A6BMH8_PRIPA|nr:hypothetical protein PRIPAC_86581 [Pristionchus pacificus]|eukprot:PDM67162.1 hypothetical protein PRIPAC_48579 [Pristionchus pacificus]